MKRNKKQLRKKVDVPRNGNPRVPRERYDRIERRVIRLEQGLGIRELDAQRKNLKERSDWMTEEELLDLERRINRIQKKIEFSDTNE